MTTYLFTVPIKFSREPHPLGATPDDLIEVEASTEVEARLTMNGSLGNGTWCSVLADDDLESIAHYPGERIPFSPRARDRGGKG